MSTRGNYVFVDYPYKKDEEGNWVKDPSQIVNLKLGISDETPLVKEGNKIYIHSDNYPSFALPNLFEFLNSKGAKARSNDSEYLSAWFVAHNAVNVLLAFCVERPEGLEYQRLSEFLREYVPKGEDILKTDDFRGIGLENSLYDGADYTYVIIPDADGFRIFIYGYRFNFITEIHSDDDLEELKEEDWWN